MIKTKLRIVLQNLNLEKAIIIITVVFYTIIMSLLTIFRMYALKSSAWDLGNYNQAMYTFVFYGKMFYMTPDIINNPTGSLFGIHFSPIFFIQAPVYLLYPKPETLLIIQSFVISLGIIPTYLIAREMFSDTKWRILLSFTYLLNPAVLGLNWFDFHPEMYIPTFFLFMVYFYIRKNWKGFWFFSLLVMSTIEFAPIMIAIFGLYSTLKDVICPFIKHKQHCLDKKLLANLLLLIIISLLWLLFALKIILMYAPQNPLLVEKTELWQTLGAHNLLQVPTYIILHPDRAIAALAVNADKKALFLIVVFLPWLLLPLFSLRFWILSSYWLIPALLSDNVLFYYVGLQYPSFFIAQATYYGIVYIRKISFKTHKFFHITAFMIIASLILSNPLLSFNVATSPWAAYGIPYISQKANDVRTLIAYIPSDASVLTNNNIFPLISSRLEAYTIPWQINYPRASFFNYVAQIVEKVDYILLDTNQWEPLTVLILSRTKEFGVLGYLDGILLLKRNYHEEPVIFRSSATSFTAINKTEPRIVLVTGRVVYDEISQSGYVFMRSSFEKIGTDFWWGPWVFILTPGVYEVTFWLKLGTNYSGDIITLAPTVFPAKVVAKLKGSPVTGYYQTITINTMQKETLPGIIVKGENLTTTNYLPISFNITAEIPGFYEFTGINVSAPIDIFLDRIDLKLVKVFPAYIRPIFIQFEDYNPILFEENYYKNIIEISKLIPDNATLLLQDELFALIIRKGASYPILNGLQNKTSFEIYLRQMFQRVEFIMLDWRSNMATTTLVLSHLTEYDDFGIYAFADGIILLKKHFHEQPVLFKPHIMKFTYKDLIPQNGTYIRQDPSSSNNFVLSHNKSNSDLWWGPYVNLFPGEYQITFKLKVQNKTEPVFFTIEINRFDWRILTDYSQNKLKIEMRFIGNKVTVLQKMITSENIKFEEDYSIITLKFVVDTFGQFEFAGRYAQTDSEIVLDEIILIMLKPYATIKIP